MLKVYLHHCSASPFSEKIRALFGYLDLEWYSVETSIIMPRTLLMPLSGGYRRVPVAQIGAEPRALVPAALGVDAKPGDTVRVTPTDYGRVPVEGELMRADAQEFAVRRTTDETGTVVTHFPRMGFALSS